MIITRILACLLQRPQDDGLIQAVKIAGGLIQKQQRRLMEKSPGKSQSLALSARQGIAQLSDRRIISLGEGGDKVMYRRLAACLLQLCLGGIQFGDSQIVGDGIVKQVGFLGDIAFHTAEILGIDLLNRAI